MSVGEELLFPCVLVQRKRIHCNRVVEMAHQLRPAT
uniref:Uncharacterized protein n=1 Tax=Anguilla anguilla TaxID=7936 RepID=A0A0E9VFB9_ANGAN